MDKKRNTQAIVIICLVIVLVGVIGYLIWVNINSSNGLVNETGTGLQREHHENEIVNDNQPSYGNVNEIKNPGLTIAEAKTIIENYLKIRGTYQGSPLEMNLLNTKFNMKADYATTTDDGYVSTNIKYQDFKDAMLKYMTEEMFKTFSYYKNINGILYAFDGGATGMGYTDVELKLVSNNNTTYEYNVKSLVHPPENGEEINFKVVVEYVNGNYLVGSWKNN